VCYCPILMILFICAILNWSCNTKLKPNEVKMMIEKHSNEKIIQAEVDSLFNRFGDNGKFLFDRDLETTPALTRFADDLKGEIIGIKPGDELGTGLPSNLRIRYGTHRDYQFIIIFRTGTDLSSIRPTVKQVINNIYCWDPDR
jgi:hypothetical protein